MARELPPRGVLQSVIEVIEADDNLVDITVGPPTGYRVEQPDDWLEDDSPAPAP